jgi:hypothetical protein
MILCQAFRRRALSPKNFSRVVTAMPVERSPWIRVATFATGWEGELAVARLATERVPARVTGNDLVGLFGPGFQGANARGFFVEVPSRYVSRAQLILARPVSPALDREDEDDSDESPKAS